MKPSWGLLLSSLYCTASAATQSLGAETARLILAQRLGLSRFHSIEHADAEAIRHINTFGGRRQKLFGAEDADRSKAHLLVWVEGVKEAEGGTVIINDASDEPKSFSIPNPPSSSDNDRLLRDFIIQAESLPAFPDPKQHTYTSGLKIEDALSSNVKVETYNEYLSVSRVTVSEKNDREQFEMLWDRVGKEAANLGFSMTMVLMPASSAKSKRSTSAWGSYDLPSLSGPRRQNHEAILSSQAEPSTSPAPLVSDLEDFPVIANQFADKGPVRGILPVCFDTMSACQKTTHNCSSHGECKLLHKGRGSGTDQQSVDCYGCACSPTVQKVNDKSRKVTYWGGPACQKKDISIQFWLFVGCGVVLAFLVSSGIGMLYSMGAEELPSVIGAGVSGPVRK